MEIWRLEGGKDLKNDVQSHTQAIFGDLILIALEDSLYE